MGYKSAADCSLDLTYGLHQFMSHSEGTALLFESDGCFNPPTAPQLPPTPTPPSFRPPTPIDSISDIKVAEKTIKKTSSIQVACRNSYKMIAILLHYFYKISSLTAIYHQRSTVHSISQISISQNTK